MHCATLAPDLLKSFDGTAASIYLSRQDTACVSAKGDVGDG